MMLHEDMFDPYLHMNEADETSIRLKVWGELGLRWIGYRSRGHSG